MNFINYKIVIGLVVSLVGAVSGLPAIMQQPINRLNWVEITKNPVSAKIVFDFAKPIVFEKKVNDRSQLVVSFHSVFREDCVPTKIEQEIARVLRDEWGILEKVVVSARKQAKKPSVDFVFSFPAMRKIEHKPGQITSVKNELSFVWQLVQNQKPNDPSYRLVLDIFLKETLDRLQQPSKVGTITLVQNDQQGKKKILA